MATLKTVINNTLASAGFVVRRQPPTDRIERLIRSIHPVETDRPLVRLGGESDGGYLVPDDFEGIVACFSPGVGPYADFEQAMCARGIPCFLADASVTGPPVENSLFHFEPRFIGVDDGGSYMRLDSWIRRCAPETGDLLLQMDIEGDEWPILLTVPDDILDRFRIIVIELHHLADAFTLSSLTVFEKVFSRLLSRFHVVHIHPNNVSWCTSLGGVEFSNAMEFTFLRKDRAAHVSAARTFPHPLDRPVSLRTPERVLPPAWFSA